MSLLAPLFMVAILLFLQGPLLQFSCAFTGARAPGYWRALLTAVLAGVLSTVAATTWGLTLGLVIKLLVGSWLAYGLSLGIAGVVAAMVYRRSLRIPFVQAVVVAIVHQVLSSGLAAAAWYLYGLF